MHLFFLFVTKTSLRQQNQQGLPKYNIAARIRFNGWQQLGDRRSENCFGTLNLVRLTYEPATSLLIQVYAHKDTLTFDTMA